jgi:hypothetical protein
VALLREVGAEAGGRAGDHGGVHPRRAGPQRSAQPRRPEGQRTGEPPAQLLDVLGLDQRLDLGAVAVVRVVVRPGPGDVEQLAHESTWASNCGST